MSTTVSGYPEIQKVPASAVRPGDQLVIVVAMSPCLVYVMHVVEVRSVPRQLRFEYDDQSMTYHLADDVVHVLSV